MVQKATVHVKYTFFSWWHLFTCENVVKIQKKVNWFVQRAEVQFGWYRQEKWQDALTVFTLNNNRITIDSAVRTDTFNDKSLTIHHGICATKKTKNYAKKLPRYLLNTLINL